MAAALDSTRELAQAALQVLQCLLDRLSEASPDEEAGAAHKALLTRLHGSHGWLSRCSTLLCPGFTEQEFVDLHGYHGMC